MVPRSQPVLPSYMQDPRVNDYSIFLIFYFSSSLPHSIFSFLLATPASSDRVISIAVCPRPSPRRSFPVTIRKFTFKNHSNSKLFSKSICIDSSLEPRFLYHLNSIFYLISIQLFPLTTSVQPMNFLSNLSYSHVPRGIKRLFTCPSTCSLAKLPASSSRMG